MVEMTGNFDRYEDGEIPFSSMKIVHVLFLEQPIPRMGAEDGIKILSQQRDIILLIYISLKF